MNDRAMAVPQSGTMARDDGSGGRELTRSADVGGDALAASAQAEVQARFAMARRFPRSQNTAEQKILDACMRPSFAAPPKPGTQTAMYARPVGGGKVAEGLSIHFAKVARQIWGNLHTSAHTIFDDAEKRVVRVSCTDLETNITEELDVLVTKFVERSFTKDGDVVIRSRLNSYGKPVYLIEASEDALAPKEKALVSKARREVILAMIPADILDMAKDQLRATQQTRDAQDPAAARRGICGAFAEIGIMPDQIEKRYLQHPLEECTPAEWGELRGLFAALRSGEIESFAAAVASKHGSDGDADLDEAAVKAKETIRRKAEAIAAKAKGAPAQAVQPKKTGPAPTITTKFSDEEQARRIDQGDPEPGSEG